MAKQYGGTRAIQPKIKTIASARSEYNVAIHKPNVIEENCYFSEKTGCSVIYEDGHIYHIEEIEVAQALADYGIDVRLQPESKAKGGISLKKNPKTNEDLFPEGQLNASFWYEQKSIDKTAESLDEKVKDGLRHAKKKGASVAIIYDRYGKIHRENVDRGIEMFNNQRKKTPHKFKSIITVNSSREVNFWEN